MDDDIAVASGAIGCWLRVVVSAEKQAKTNAGVLPLRQAQGQDDRVKQRRLGKLEGADEGDCGQVFSAFSFGEG
jgi:hypothetical protein